ncbi:hypothetical protein [Bordetella sp. H567]|uniref:hypothetical protein n=1 Tax=Bordetella sp. H567 TaxID=1697043 RepID=UPI0011AB3186|nr:hypothetical protein [Bordetella sp. H567]
MVSAIAEDEHTGAAIIAPHGPYAYTAAITFRLSIRASHFPSSIAAPSAVAIARLFVRSFATAAERTIPGFPTQHRYRQRRQR